MKIQRTLPLLIIVFMLALAGCSQVTTLPADEAEAFAASVDEIVEETLQGLNNHDYEQHSRYFDEEMLDTFDLVVFDQIHDEVIGVTGPYVSRELNRVEDSGRMLAVVYDAVFENDSAVTVRVVFWETDPEHLVTGLWFDSELLREALNQ